MNNKQHESFAGSTLRDWFAGMALQGLIAEGKPLDETTVDTAFRMADLMLKKRG